MLSRVYRPPSHPGVSRSIVRVALMSVIQQYRQATWMPSPKWSSIHCLRIARSCDDPRSFRLVVPLRLVIGAPSSAEYPGIDPKFYCRVTASLPSGSCHPIA